jgi:hypothetical protein
MMANIPTFATRAELVNALRGCDWKDWFRNLQSKRWDLEEICIQSVGPNTFRYFRRLPSPPSQVFRAWAFRMVNEQLVIELLGCTTQSEFDTLLRRLALSLRREWVRSMGEPMELGPAIKLPSLVLKHLCGSMHVPRRSMNVATRFLHVPLDSYTLGSVRHVHNAGTRGSRSPIPSGVGMGWVSDWRTYTDIQWTIQECAAEAREPAVAFDIVAWNIPH